LMSFSTGVLKFSAFFSKEVTSLMLSIHVFFDRCTQVSKLFLKEGTKCFCK
jgi:hypothetical protein